MPQRILYIQKPAGGGSSRSLYELVRGLDRKKFEPIVIFFQQNSLISKFENLGVRTITLGWVGQRIQKKRSSDRKVSKLSEIIDFFTYEVPLAIQIIRIAKTENIDLIHQNLGFERPVMIAASVLRLPQVCHFRHFSTISKSKKWLASSVDAGIFISNAIQKFYLEQSIPFGSSEVIYNPVDIESFVNARRTSKIRKEFGITEKDKLIINIGRITPWKGQFFFLNAIENIIKEYPSTKALIVGETGPSKEDKEYLKILKERVDTSFLNKHIFFTGERDDIAEVMTESDIVVHSASEPEPFGRVIVEAMAAGTPIIATRAGGVAEIIEDGVTGLLVPLKNDFVMTNAIRTLLDSTLYANKLAVKAQDEVSKRYLVSNHVTKVQDLYTNILKQKSPT